MPDPDETTDAADEYEWVSNGGCERCDALDGHTCELPWPRQHPKCDCTIISRSRSALQCDMSDVSYEVEYAGPNHHGGDPDPDDEFDLIYDYTIHCWGGAQVITGEVVVSRTYLQYSDEDPYDFLDDAYDEALQRVEEIAAAECPACPAPRLV